MTITETCKRYIISESELNNYETNGFLTVKLSAKGEKEYCEEDLKRLGLIKVLIEVGFTVGEIKKYLKLTKELNKDDEQIRMLKIHRRKLLTDIRSKQKLLDQLDFIIREKNTQTLNLNLGGIL